MNPETYLKAEFLPRFLAFDSQQITNHMFEEDDMDIIMEDAEMDVYLSDDDEMDKQPGPVEEDKGVNLNREREHAIGMLKRYIAQFPEQICPTYKYCIYRGDECKHLNNNIEIARKYYEATDFPSRPLVFYSKEDEKLVHRYIREHPGKGCIAVKGCNGKNCMHAAENLRLVKLYYDSHKSATEPSDWVGDESGPENSEYMDLGPSMQGQADLDELAILNNGISPLQEFYSESSDTSDMKVQPGIFDLTDSNFDHTAPEPLEGVKYRRGFDVLPVLYSKEDQKLINRYISEHAKHPCVTKKGCPGNQCHHARDNLNLAKLYYENQPPTQEFASPDNIRSSSLSETEMMLEPPIDLPTCVSSIASRPPKPQDEAYFDENIESEFKQGPQVPLISRSINAGRNIFRRLFPREKTEEELMAESRINIYYHLSHMRPVTPPPVKGEPYMTPEHMEAAAIESANGNIKPWGTRLHSNAIHLVDRVKFELTPFTDSGLKKEEEASPAEQSTGLEAVTLETPDHPDESHAESQKDTTTQDTETDGADSNNEEYTEMGWTTTTRENTIPAPPVTVEELKFEGNSKPLENTEAGIKWPWSNMIMGIDSNQFIYFIFSVVGFCFLVIGPMLLYSRPLSRVRPEQSENIVKPATFLPSVHLETLRNTIPNPAPKRQYRKLYSTTTQTPNVLTFPSSSAITHAWKQYQEATTMNTNHNYNPYWSRYPEGLNPAINPAKPSRARATKYTSPRQSIWCKMNPFCFSARRRNFQLILPDEIDELEDARAPRTPISFWERDVMAAVNTINKYNPIYWWEDKVASGIGLVTGGSFFHSPDQERGKRKTYRATISEWLDIYGREESSQPNTEEYQVDIIVRNVKQSELVWNDFLPWTVWQKLDEKEILFFK